MKMDRNVLLLNQNYEPLAFCNAKKAIVLIFLGKAEAVENDNVEVHSVNFRMPMPLVVRLSRHARTPRRRVILNRKNLLIRDGHACQYCGKSTPPLTIDHIVPRQRGGGDTWENLVIACLGCNNRKGNRTPDQAGMKLLSRPKAPNPYFFFQHFAGDKHERWKPYLFMS